MDDGGEGSDVELYLLRHAHAGDPAKWKGDDALRPLSEKGRGQAQRLGTFLAERGLSLDAIVTSPRLRARQTAELVADALGVTFTEDRLLAGPLDADVVRDIVTAANGERVMLVGHDPDFSDLAAMLTGAAELPLRKGALARIDLQLPIRNGAGVLRWLIPPDLLATASSGDRVLRT